MKLNQAIKPFILALNILIIAMIVVVLTYFNYAPHPDAPLAKQGVLDLRGWDFNKQGIVNLNGEWEFYDGLLLKPEAFKQTTALKSYPKAFIKAPYPWKGQKNRQRHSSQGIGTYRLVVLINPTIEDFGVKITSIRMAHRLYVNGILRGSSGNPAAKGLGLYWPGNTPYSTFFNVTGNRLEIIVQVANYTYFSGGIVNPLRFGLQTEIIHLQQVVTALELAVVIVLLLFGTYHLLVFLMGNRDFSFLYCGIYFLLLAIFNFCYGEKIFMQFFPRVPFEIAYRITDISYSLSVIILALFIKAMGTDFISKLMLRLVKWVMIPYLLAILFLPYLIYSSFKNLIWGFMALFILGIFIKLIIAYCKKNYGSLEKSGLRLLIMGIAFILFYVCVSVLYINNDIDNDIVGKLAFFGFIFMMALLIATKYSNTYQRMEQVSERLIVSDQLKDEFLAKTSHELKTPLHGIINISATLLEDPGGELTEDQIANLKLINRISSRLSSLVNDLLDVTRLKNGEITMNFSIVDLRVSADIIFETFRFLAQGKELRFTNLISADALVKADENRLFQILYNLIDNAVKHTEKGSITVSSRESGGMIDIMVEDTGSGIPAAKFESIFDSYEQVEITQVGYSGLGLGLFISRQLVGLMQGSIYLDWSQEGIGSRFGFSLPKAEFGEQGQMGGVMSQSASTLESPALEEARSLDIQKGYQFTILVVDDELANIQVLLNIFANEGFNVLTAFSGEEALEKMKRLQIDLVLLDVMMPGISGLDVCRQIRVEHSLLDVPILIITARNTRYDMLLGFDVGANDFISKPFDANEIRARVRTLMAMKKSIDEAFKSEMAFLQAQIKPHFLYNTISTIISFCHTDSKQAADLLMEFSKYLRLSFDVDSSIMLIPLTKELELIQAYVAIEQARFGERLRVEYELDDRAMALMIPPLIIQPLVENAIRHGVCKKEGGGMVQLQVKQMNEAVRISISDNGVGMGEVTKERLLSNLNSAQGIGIANVKRRMAKIPGSSLNITSNPGEGTTVTLEFPATTIEIS